ncbi:MAG: hypothetical protein HY867_05380 [Chloroflexi bacterium]|nr:hypothetical protein [Chloroflexota bacterium]
MKNGSIVTFLLMCILTACTALPDRVANSENSQEISNRVECPEAMPTPKSKPVFLKWVFPVGAIEKAEFDNLIESHISSRS